MFSLCRISNGKVFHIRGAADVKALSPTVFNLVAGT